MIDDITVSDLEVMSGAIRYRKWLFGQVAPYVGRRVLELGAGIGNYTEFLLDRDKVICVELNADAVAILKERFSAHTQIQVIRGDIADPSLSVLQEHACDTALCFNVLEHVADDVAALRNVAKMINPGGRLLLIVPAIPGVFGTVDRSLGHYRRYTRSAATSALVAAGYQVEHMAYFNIVGIAGWFWNNRVIRRTQESLQQILFYDRFVVPWLAPLERVFKPPIGLSLVCIARTQV